VSFEFFCGVPRSILYDNASWRWHASWVTAGANERGASVSCSRTICSPTASGGRARARSKGWWNMRRGNFLVPIPQMTSFAELNARLLEGCRHRWSERLRGHDETIGERLTRDRGAFLSPPQAPYDACEKRAARVNSLSLVRYRAMTIRCRLSMGIAKCWCAATSTRW
jgi:hypothetical protein